MNKYSAITLTVLGIASLALVYVLFSPRMKAGTDTAVLEELAQLRKSNIALRQSTLKLDRELLQLKQETDSLQILITEDRKLITNLKLREYERIKAIDNFDTAALIEFFSRFDPEDQSKTDHSEDGQ